jgi:hypothetical protein
LSYMRYYFKTLNRILRRPLKIRKASTARDALKWAYWSEKSDIRLEVPLSMVRMIHGGFAYGPDHPFCRALSEGPQALSSFYDLFQPADLADAYAPKTKHLVGSDLPAWELPWRFRENRSPPPGEKGLSVRHGVAFWGPCSEEKVALEYRRLSKTLESVERSGYLPSNYGDIEGHFMTDGQNTVFTVLGGKHRAAVLAHLGYDTIQIRIRPGLLSVIDARAVNDWPMVSNGTVDRELALLIMNVYIEGRGMSDFLERAAIS